MAAIFSSCLIALRFILSCFKGRLILLFL